MGQRARILTEVFGFDGWRVKEAYFESADGVRVVPIGGYAMLRETKVVLVVERVRFARCSACTGVCRAIHERGPKRRWADLPAEWDCGRRRRRRSAWSTPQRAFRPFHRSAD